MSTSAPRRALPTSTALPRVIAAILVLAWLAVGGIGGPLVGRLSEVQKNSNAAFLPSDAESTKVLEGQKVFSDDTALPILVVVERAGGISKADTGTVAAFAKDLTATDLELDGPRPLSDYLLTTQIAPVPSEDGDAILLVLPMRSSQASETIGETTPLKAAVEAIREQRSTLTDAGFTVQVTGPGGFIADLSAAFAGIDGLLLLVALGVVLVILLIVYRSPVLPFVVLLSAVLGLAAAVMIVFPLAEHGIIELSGQSQGILFILVVGAATDYALLLVSRFKEALHDTEHTWEALKVAWRSSVEPILASGFTVILGLLCLLLSKLGNTAGLGPVGALGIVGAMAAALTFLPAVLLLGGRRLFWPAIPRVDHEHRSEDALSRRLGWGTVARWVGNAPRRTWVVTALVLIALAAFAPTFRSTGTSTSETFLTTVESVTGQETLAKHFPGGSGSPVEILTTEDDYADVMATAAGVDGIDTPYAGEFPGAPPTIKDGKVLVRATLTAAPDSAEAEAAVTELRDVLDEVSPDALVGGDTAQTIDTLASAERDQRVIIPAIIGVVFVVLILLLRSLVAPLLLIVANIVSFAATLGVAAIAFNHIWRFPGADPSVPLYGFVFLVALGVDYSIFLMTRAREETAHQGPTDGMLTALSVTGGVITSAGIVLASTFSALAVIPLLFLAQIAFIVAFGVLLDTLVVRSLLVPAFSIDLGRWTWWPSRLSRPRNPDQAIDEPDAHEEPQPDLGQARRGVPG